MANPVNYASFLNMNKGNVSDIMTGIGSGVSGAVNTVVDIKKERNRKNINEKLYDYAVEKFREKGVSDNTIENLIGARTQATKLSYDDVKKRIGNAIASLDKDYNVKFDNISKTATDFGVNYNPNVRNSISRERLLKRYSPNDPIANNTQTFVDEKQDIPISNNYNDMDSLQTYNNNIPEYNDIIAQSTVKPVINQKPVTGNAQLSNLGNDFYLKSLEQRRFKVLSDLENNLLTPEETKKQLANIEKAKNDYRTALIQQETERIKQANDIFKTAINSGRDITKGGKPTDFDPYNSAGYTVGNNKLPTISKNYSFSNKNNAPMQQRKQFNSEFKDQSNYVAKLYKDANIWRNGGVIDDGETKRYVKADTNEYRSAIRNANVAELAKMLMQDYNMTRIEANKRASNAFDDGVIYDVSQPDVDVIRDKKTGEPLAFNFANPTVKKDISDFAKNGGMVSEALQQLKDAWKNGSDLANKAVNPLLNNGVNTNLLGTGRYSE